MWIMRMGTTMSNYVKCPRCGYEKAVQGFHLEVYCKNCDRELPKETKQDSKVWVATNGSIICYDYYPDGRL